MAGSLDSGPTRVSEAAAFADGSVASEVEGAANDGAVVDGGRADSAVLDSSAARDGSLDGAVGQGEGAACTTAASNTVRCTTRTIEMIGASGDVRRVYWAQPTSAAPPDGYPAVLLFQGTGAGPATTWNVDVAMDVPFGGYYQVALIARLVESGFVVIQPEAKGGVAWSTNVAFGNYEDSADGVFMPTLLTKLSEGTFGKLDARRWYATGISSGGYMTSRMAVSYPGKFRALAIESGSYATCLGPLCTIPAQLPKDHPPTLLLHGAKDSIVGIDTARDYEAKLKSNGIEVKFVEDPAAGHEWLKTAPTDVTEWFLAH